ncbi:hypothetical protein [Paractinoplanes rishiriensis]|nr:hypothetical protein [Actinoplanes rishiriensis]
MTTTIATTNTANPARTWRRLAGAALIAWPLMHFGGFVTSPPGETHEPAVFREHATLVQISAVLLHYSAVLIVAVVLGMAYLLYDRMPRLAVGAAIVGVLAAVNGSGLLMMDFYDLALAETIPDAQAVAVTGQAAAYGGFVYGFLLPAFLLHPVLIGLTVALVRAGLARWWQPVLLVGGLALPFLVADQPAAVQALGAVLILGALAPTAVRVLR